MRPFTPDFPTYWKRNKRQIENTGKCMGELKRLLDILFAFPEQWHEGKGTKAKAGMAQNWRAEVTNFKINLFTYVHSRCLESQNKLKIKRQKHLSILLFRFVTIRL